MKYTHIAYKIITIVLALVFLKQGIEQVLLTEHMLAEYGTSGLPEYMLQFMGIAKILAAGAISIAAFWRVPVAWRWLVEWAYAGLSFILVGAAVSHIIMQFEMGHLVTIPVLLLLVLWSAYIWRTGV